MADTALAKRVVEGKVAFQGWRCVMCGCLTRKSCIICLRPLCESGLGIWSRCVVSHDAAIHATFPVERYRSRIGERGHACPLWNHQLRRGGAYPYRLRRLA